MENNNPKTITVKERGPSPGIPASLYFLLFAAGVVCNLMGTSGGTYPTPYDPIEKAQDYYNNHADIVRIASFFLFWSALPLGIFTAFMTSRLRALDLHSGGVLIARFGGFASALFLAFSGLFSWVLSQPSIASDATTTRSIQLMAFATGGTGYVVFSALLISGISVTAGLGKVIPKWQMWLGLGIAVVSVFSMLNMIFPQVSLLLPLGRFTGIIWMIIAGFSLRRSRVVQ
jgi:hypothetical protein